jgi:hypothetical protein
MAGPRVERGDSGSNYVGFSIIETQCAPCASLPFLTHLKSLISSMIISEISCEHSTHPMASENYHGQTILILSVNFNSSRGNID